MALLNSLIVNNPIYEQYRKALSKLNKSTVSLIQDKSYQSKNMFELILYPHTFTLNPFIIAQIATDNLLIKTNLASIPNIPSAKLEYETVGYEKYINALTPPEELQMMFYEDESGSVFNWLDGWKSKIYNYDFVFGRVFNADQDGAKKDGFLTLHSKTGLPVPYVWKLTGLNYKNIEDFGVGHEETEILTITASFDIMDIEILSLSDFIGLTALL